MEKELNFTNVINNTVKTHQSNDYSHQINNIDKNINEKLFQINLDSNSNNSEEIQDEKKSKKDKKEKYGVMKISEELAYLRIKNLKLKEKEKIAIETINKLIDEKANLNSYFEKLNLKLLNEKKIRKQIEEQLLDLFKKECENKKIKENLIAENEKNKVLLKNHDNESEKSKYLIKNLELEINELKNNLADLQSNNFIRRTSFTFSSDNIEIKRDSFSISSNNLNDKNVINSNNNNANQVFNKNKNINLINGINLNNQMEENFFRGNSNSQKERLSQNFITESNKANYNDNVISNVTKEKGNSNKDENLNQRRLSDDTNLNSTNLKEKANKELCNKFDIDKLKNSLKIEFLEYEKDNLSIRRKITAKEEKLQKLEKIIKTWHEYSEIIKKNFDNLGISLNNLNENFLLDVEIFDECPDLISLIYIIQSILSDLSVQIKIFSSSLENSFLNQIKTFISCHIQEIKEAKSIVIKNQEEFNTIAAKFLNTKKSNIKDIQKDNYDSVNKTLEYSRYDYINKINSAFLFTKVDLPEKVSLFIYSFMSLFRQGCDILSKIEFNLNANLEKISVKYKEKEKISEDMKRGKSLLKNFLESVNLNLDNKEGFIHVKSKDSNQYFKKRYFKVFQGNLIYFKIKKGTDIIDTSKFYTLVNLLLSNVKRNERDYEFPFCFEIISASNKKAFILQAENEKEAEEWHVCIRNAIANSISQYNNPTNSANPSVNTGFSNNLNIFNYEKLSKDYANININLDNSFNMNMGSIGKLNSPNNQFFAGAKTNAYDNMLKFETFSISDSQSCIEKMIQLNKCSDCNNDNPTWCSINWLTLICIDCSGVHRGLGVQVSKIRSLRLDNLENELIETLLVLNQEKLNTILEYELDKLKKSKPKANSLQNEKESFIGNKYKYRKYLRPTREYFDISKNDAVISSYEEVGIRKVFEFIEEDDLLNVYWLLKSDIIEVNKNYFNEKEKENYSLMHHSAKIGRIYILKLLILLGGDINFSDVKNLKPIDYATIYKKSEIVDYIVKKIEESSNK